MAPLVIQKTDANALHSYLIDIHSKDVDFYDLYWKPNLYPIPEVLEHIAVCESGGRQFDDKGEVIKGRVNPKDIGKYQINLDHHGSEAKALGLDLFNEQDNELFALWLYKNRGTKPWYLSESCWGIAKK